MKTQPMSSSKHPHHLHQQVQERIHVLVVLLDLNPFEWAKRLLPRKQSNERPVLTFSQFLNHLFVFLNAHLISKHTHKLCVIGSNQKKTEFLFPCAEEMLQEYVAAKHDTREEEKKKKKRKRSQTKETSVNEQFKEDYFVREHNFEKIQTTILKKLHSVMNQNIMVEEDLAPNKKGSSLAASLSLALCYLNRMQRDKPLGTLIEPRILAFSVSPDTSAQYISVLNTIFCAQKMVPPKSLLTDRFS